jgi:hypothetical protein
MNDTPVTFSREEWLAFRASYSELKHSINNALAVFSALSELAHRNPDNYEKLGKSILTRTPDIVALMQEFTQALDEKRPPSLEDEL